MIYRELDSFDVPVHGGDPSGLFGTDIVRMPKRPGTVGLDDGSLPTPVPAGNPPSMGVITATILPLVTSVDTSTTTAASAGSPSGATANSVAADGSVLIPALTAVSPVGGLTWGTLIIYAVIAYVVWRWIR